MTEIITKPLGFFKTTAIGGLLFLLPVAVIGAVLGYVHEIVETVYEMVKGVIPLETKFGFFLLFLISILIVLLLCFFCGLITKRTFARKFSQKIEKQVMMVYPKYAIYKDILAGNIGGDENVPSLTPVSVRFNEFTRLAFESDRLPDGRVVVYLPGSPDPWIGTVVLVNADQVEPLNIPFHDAVGIFERLGRDAARLPIAHK
jgi:uncharacterized membrane protein